MEIDAIGAAEGALAGGMAAHAIDPEKGHAGQHSHNCADCGTPLTGRYCSECGQPAHVHRTLVHLGHELLHGVMHFDGRIWRTLPLLLVNPGKLTREWCQGKRSRYVSPLAIFLFTLFIIFFGLSMASPPKVNMGSNIDVASMSQTDVDALKAELAEMDKEVAALDVAFAQAKGADKIALGTQKGALAGTHAALKARVTAYETAKAEGKLPVPGKARSDGLEPGSWQAQVADLNWQSDGHGAMAKIGKKLKNPDLMLYKLQQTAYKFAFLLVPLSIPFMWLLFLWRRGFTLYDHGVFVLYSLTFMAMLTVVAALLGGLAPALGSVLVWLVMTIVPVHMFAQLKGAYGLSVFSALWRTGFLMVFCTIVVSLFLTAIVYLGLGH
ncbi:DUF3667 domain-containing protein [Brevundimonas pishanensis]|uniref:DUF3667 domain-containing protein n=1 Tax=Brevundimonas pishanensis TaxID=2896315 RepID=UPI001FA6F218|nr:DUF3667 domain-containing protein [Brevundimonas pishanensis]